MPIKVLLVFGTRPEAIKMAPLYTQLISNKKIFDTKVCVTAQHREMLDQVLKIFNVKVDFDFNIMKKKQTLATITSSIIKKLDAVIKEINPDYVFVHGDTTTTLASSLACFYNKIKLCHVEAGLRTYNKFSPFPEEINRKLTSSLADYHFAPTENSKVNLINEDIPQNKILVTGNTVIDSLLMVKEKLKEYDSKVVKSLKKLINNHKIVLVTGHRRENFGEGFINICSAIKIIAQTQPNIKIIYPVHLNPNVQDPVSKHLSSIENIILTDPLEYIDFIWLMNRSSIILTDSGGIQEEAPSLGKPVLVLRNTTERPEAVEKGTVKLVGTDVDKIVNTTIKLLNDEKLYRKMSGLHNPYGDGKSCKRIVDFIKRDYGI